MKNSTKKMTPQESLEIISRFISNYRKNYRSDSFFFLLWGWIIALASIFHFAILKTLLVTEKYQWINISSGVTWGVFITVGLIIQYSRIRKISKESISRNHFDRFMSILWQTGGWGILLVAVLSVKLGVYPTPFVLAVAGIATFITGTLIRFNPLKIGGIIFFIFAILASFVTNEYQLLINAVAIILGYIIPGYQLRNSNPEQFDENKTGQFEEQ